MNSVSSRSFLVRLGCRSALPALIFCGFSLLATSTNELPTHSRGYAYNNDVVPDVPWSIHVFKIDRAHHEFSFQTTLGGAGALGMANVSAQIQKLPTGKGHPLAAVNGDYYDKSPKYQGRPRDLQVCAGEVVSSPAGHTCFWVGPSGEPHMTNVYSRFTIGWSDGTSTPFSMNEDRGNEAAVLYTPIVGRSTHTSGGTELILEPGTATDWSPFRLGMKYSVRVREVRTAGDSPVSRTNFVLSIGPGLTIPSAALKAGAVISISTETVPDLTGVETAIGGGPALVREGQVMQWPGTMQVRHPRTALGWNKDAIFLVAVDGRERYLSVGMTFPELAAYMRKLGCDEAMNFDGGGSSTLWAMGNVMNNPSEGRERPAPNALVILTQLGY